MNKQKTQKEWRGLSEDVITGMTEWRDQHSKATLREIEEEIDKRLSVMRARMISDAAMNSASAKWEVGEKAAVCPTCGVALIKKRKKKRELQTRGGREIELEREYGVCPECGQGIFPLDEELKLLPGKLTLNGHERSVRLSGWMPFEKAVELFEDFMGIRVRKIVSQRYTEEAGAVYEQIQNEEVQRLQKRMPRAKAQDKTYAIARVRVSFAGRQGREYLNRQR